jgi:hypothetical protein
MAATQNDDGMLTEAGGDPNARPGIPGHQQHRLTPATQRALGLEHHEPTQLPSQILLHAMVPAVGHTA